MPANAVPPLQLEVRLHRPLEQRRVVPRRSVVHDRRAGRRRHRPELPVELLGVDVLRLVHLQQHPRRVPDDVRGRLRRKEELPRVAQPNRPGPRPTGSPRMPACAIRVPQPPQADLALRLERRRALDAVDRPARVLRKQDSSTSGGQLVLPRLPRHHDRESQPAPFSAESMIASRRLTLVRPQPGHSRRDSSGSASSERPCRSFARVGVHATNLSTTCVITAPRTTKISPLIRPLRSPTSRSRFASRNSTDARKAAADGPPGAAPLAFGRPAESGDRAFERVGHLEHLCALE